MPNCDRCGDTQIARNNVFGYGNLCIDCYCLIIYGRTNNNDPKERTPTRNTQLTDYE